MTSRRNRLSQVWFAFDGLGADAAWTLVHDLLATAVALFSFWLLLWTFDPLAMGGVYAVYALIGPLSSLTFAGPGLALLQRRLRYGDGLDDIARSFLSVSLVAGGVLSVAAVVVGTRLIPQLSTVEIALFAASELFAHSMIFVCSMLTQAAVDYPAMIKVRLGLVGCKLINLALLSAVGGLTLVNLAGGYLVVYGLYAAWLVGVYLPRVGYRVRLGRPSRTALSSSATFAVPIAAANLQTEGDKVALNSFGFGVENGFYGAAYRVLHFGALPVRVLGQAAFHRFLTDDDDVGSRPLTRAAKLTGVMVILASVTALGLIVLAETPLIDVLIPPRYAESQTMLRWLTLTLPLLAMSGTPMNGLLGLGRDKERAMVYVASALVSVVAYVVLIPGRGWPGAVAATLISEALLVVTGWAAMIHYQRVADTSTDRTATLSGEGLIDVRDRDESAANSPASRAASMLES